MRHSVQKWATLQMKNLVMVLVLTKTVHYFSCLLALFISLSSFPSGKKLRHLLISVQSFCWASSPLISLSRFKLPVQSFGWKNNTFISTFPLIMIIIIILNKKKGFLEISYLILLIGLSFWRCIPRRRSYSSKRNTIATRDTYVSYGRCCQSS